MAGPNESSGPPVFVMGTPRSGTTLTARILSNHSRIFIPAETHFFDDIYARRRQLGDPADAAAMRRIAERLSTLYLRQHEGQFRKQFGGLLEDPDEIIRRMGPCRDYRDVMTRFMGMQMREAGKVRWGNQVPRDLFNVTDILTFYPDAKVVVCVRDVRDFLLSYSGMKNVVPASYRARQRRLYHPAVAALLWRASVRRIPAIRRQVDPGNIMVIRYEDLVGDPRVVVEALCGMIGEAFEPAMLEVSENNSSDGKRRENASGIFGSSVGRWRRGLPPEHAWIGQMVAGRDLRALGYEPQAIAVRRIRVVLLLVAIPFALLRGLLANRAKQASLLPYLAKRLAPLFSTSRQPS
ncbi:MAG: hypothetical protein HKM95_03440 [Inquilinus sp.]|nr:hypothetical protein [Inquilinus sp.]